MIPFFMIGNKAGIFALTSPSRHLIGCPIRVLIRQKEKETEHYICSTEKRKVIYNGSKKVDNSQVKQVKKRIPHHPHHGLRLF